MAKAVRRYGLAIFRGWPELLHAIGALARVPEASQTLSLMSLPRLFNHSTLHAATSGLDPKLQHAIEKRFDLTVCQPESGMSCTAGPLADQLACRARHGCWTVDELLSAWMLAKQAARIDDDVRQGRTLLWAKLFTPEQEQSTCETLLNARPLRLDVLDLVQIPPPIMAPDGVDNAANT